MDFSYLKNLFSPEEPQNSEADKQLKLAALSNLQNKSVAPLPEEEVDLTRENPLARQISSQGLDIIKRNEALKLKAYQDPIGKTTIGYGHTGPEVTPDMEIDEPKADELLKNHISGLEKQVGSMVQVPLSQEQFSALVSLGYNIGPSALKNSTLVKLLNQGKYPEAAQEFDKWNKAGGKVLPGLTKRRGEEKNLFLSQKVASNEE